MPYIRPYAGKYRVEVVKNGHRASKLCDTKGEAVAWGNEKEAEFDEVKTASKRTFQAAVEHYLETVSSRKKDGAVLWESRRFAAMAEYFGPGTPLVKVDSAFIGRWRDNRLKTVSEATVLREYNLLRNLMTIARVEWKWLKESATDGVRMPKEDEESRAEYIWGWRDIRTVLRHCLSSPGLKTQEVGIAFHVALRTALRMKEALAAKMDGQVIVLRDSKTTKAGKLIKVPTTHQGRRVMKKYSKRLPLTVSTNEASVLFHEACVACGIRQRGEDGMTFHDSRATALTHMSKKMPVQHLQKISRHRDINILIRRYYRETAEQISANL